jgi:tetratricopeptide (TPR) repeat protein
MSRRRWQHLDREKPRPAPGPSERRAVSQPLSPVASVPREPSDPAPPPPELARARNCYRLGQYAASLDELQRIDPAASIPGLERLRGWSLGRLGEPAAAAAALDAALRDEPDDLELWGSLASAQMQAGLVPELPTFSRVEGAGVGELVGAVLWLRGREAARRLRAPAAAAAFSAAACQFVASSPESTLGERLAACLVGETISLMLADDLCGAQQALSRLPRRERLPPAALDFARRLWEFAAAAAELPHEERRRALQPLRQLLEATNLSVRFFDGTEPVVLTWAPLPAAGL